MRKFLILFVAMAMSIGCSNDDNNSEGIVVKDLVLSMNNKDIYVGDEVLFTVLDREGKKVDASIYVGNTLVKNPVIFDKAGNFNVIAKKEGFENSKSLEVSVKEKGESLSQLVLSASNVALKVGEKVSFSITANDVVVDSALVYNAATGIALPNNVFEATTAGEFTFVAKKEGFADSAEVSVEVIREENLLLVNDEPVDFSLVIFDVIQESVVDNNGNEKIVDKVVYLEDGRLANEYSLMIVDENNYTVLTLWVVNKTIVMKDNMIVDYGKRVLPSDAENIIFSDLFVVGNYFIFENFLNVESFKILVKQLTIPNDGIGAGSDGVFGSVNFGFNFESLDNKVDFNFNGELFFTETLEEDSKAYKIRNK